MNDSFEDYILGGVGGSYMSLGHQEKSELIFKDIKNSYIFWQIKKAIKDEIVKSKGKPSDITDMIPKLLVDLNLETKIKNKVHEILDKNGYFRDSAQVAITKFKNCKDLNSLPQYFFDKDYEPLESVATAKRAWSEQLKQKLNSLLRQSRKPFIRPKKRNLPLSNPKKPKSPATQLRVTLNRRLQWRLGRCRKRRRWRRARFWGWRCLLYMTAIWWWTLYSRSTLLTLLGIWCFLGDR